MKRRTLAVILLSALSVSLLAETLLVNSAKANPFPTYPVISVESPANKVYTENSLFLNVTLVTKWDGLYFTSERWISYCIDGKVSIPLSQTEYWFDEETQSSIVSGSAVLADLAEGTHTLRVNAEYSYDNGQQVFTSSSSVDFTIDPDYSPSPISSPTPTVTPSPSPSATPTATPAPTAPPSPEPTSTPEPESLPTTFAIIASGASVAVVALGLTVCFKKRHIRAGEKA